MKGYLAVALALLFVLKLDYVSSKTQCGFEEHSPAALRLSIVSRRNLTGSWITKIVALKDDSELDEDKEMVVDVSQDVVYCSGRRQIVIRGHIAGFQLPEGNHTRVEKEYDVKRLRFHRRSAQNARVSEDGRTVEKIELTESGWGSAFTNRPLKDNELFEVILERKLTTFSYSLAIGASPYSPENVNFAELMYNMLKPNWSYYANSINHNNNQVKSGYGKNLDTLVVGDRVGVMRKSNGNLHFFVNGEDQGVAATGLPRHVYGIVELYANAAKISVVKPS